MSFKTIRAEKREWNKLQKRVKALPSDYRYVYKQMLKYIYKTVNLDSQQLIEFNLEIIELFESGAREGKHVLEITGRDVASFCDQLTVDMTSYMEEIESEIEESIRRALLKQK